MSKRSIAGMFLVMLTAYLAGLVIFLPPERLQGWSGSIIGDRLTWKELALGWEGVRLNKLRVNPPIFHPDREIDSLLLSPRFLPLFVGRLALGYDLGLDILRLTGEASWNGREARLEWQNRMEELSKLATLWLGPLGAEIRGKGEGTGWLAATTQPPQSVESGEWETRLQGLTAFGAKIDPMTFNGRIKEKNVMEITVAGKGDIAVSGKITLKITLPNPQAGPVSGELQIQPLKTNLPGMAGQFLARGQAVRLVLSGTLENLQWRMAQ
ncbi:MAG: hypothetical protein HQL95_12220 [Magnetococcales bacterium]|nr:hypothetical protein [Magnetococcales bacterium]